MTSVILKEGMCLKETFGAYSMTGRIYENFAYCSLFSLKVGSPFSVFALQHLTRCTHYYTVSSKLWKKLLKPLTQVWKMACFGLN